MAEGMQERTILVIDDDAMARDIYRSVLESGGFRVLTAGSGAEGLEIYRAQAVHCVLLDIFMPGLSGLDLLEEFDPEVSGIPVIAISGGGTVTGAHPLKLAETLGASRTFSKDFEHEELLAAVRELTGG